MKTDMKDLVEYLINCNKKLMILTLPPIPKVAKDIGIRGKVKDFNRFIRALDNGDTIKINHVTPHFVDHNELGCNLKYFEQNINFGGKTFADLVHLNIDGLKLLKESIDEFFNQTNEELKGVVQSNQNQIIMDQNMADDFLDESNYNDGVMRDRVQSLPEIDIGIGGVKYKCLVDSGSQACIMSDEFYKKIKNQVGYNIPELPVSNLSIVGVTGVRSKRINVQIRLEEEEV
ncbi:hypothetical protein J6590_000627 [Homalodisca vitripennis]|nr:hypothetical protein J6590_000627 [Homalodisca vitripennis]